MKTRRVPSCPVCAKPGGIWQAELTDRSQGVEGAWTLARCTSCNIAWLDPRPDDEDLALCYPAAYYTHDARNESLSLGRSGLVARLRALVLSARYGYRHLASPVPGSGFAGLLLSATPGVTKKATWFLNDGMPPWRDGGELLDIGCGAGDYIGRMKLLGWKVYGLEPDPEAARVAEQKVQPTRIWKSTLDEADFGNQRFDVISSFHAIEHTPDPRGFLMTAASLLKPKGRLFVATPNFSSLGRKLFDRDWYALDPPRHFTLLSPDSLRLLCEQSGLFSRVRVRTVSQQSHLSIVRYFAIGATGNPLGNHSLTPSERVQKLLFCGVEAAGNRLFKWGNEVQVVAVRK